MALWLFKEEPTTYSFADLERDGRTTWAGVRNALARQNLRRLAVGDRVFFYHTGKEKAVVGEMRVVSEPRADESSDDDKAVVVDVEPVRRLPHPVTLARIKAEAALADWDLIRMPRLSVMPVSVGQWRKVEEMGKRAE